MAATYIKAVRDLERQREIVRSLAAKPDTPPDVIANYNGQAWAYSQAIRLLHELFYPYLPVEEVERLAAQYA